MTHLANPLLKVAKTDRFVSLEKYFQAEEKALHKHEYHNGKIIKMAGGSFNHDNLAIKTAKLIDNFVEDNDLSYLVNGSDTKIRIEDEDRVVYADALVICDKPIFYNDRTDTIVNPLIIVEIQPPPAPPKEGRKNTIEKFDKGDKFSFYRTLESFKEYVLVRQDRKYVSVYTKQPDNNWLLRDYIGDDAVAVLYALHDCPLPLKRLYRGLEIK
jgi:Uma2 family endonuclease